MGIGSTTNQFFMRKPWISPMIWRSSPLPRCVVDGLVPGTTYEVRGARSLGARWSDTPKSKSLGVLKMFEKWWFTMVLL